jgi:hypothetical protein
VHILPKMQDDNKYFYGNDFTFQNCFIQAASGRTKLNGLGQLFPITEQKLDSENGNYVTKNEIEAQLFTPIEPADTSVMQSYVALTLESQIDGIGQDDFTITNNLENKEYFSGEPFSVTVSANSNSKLIEGSLIFQVKISLAFDVVDISEMR